MKSILYAFLILCLPLVAPAQNWVQVPPQTSWNLYGCWFDPTNPDHGAITGWRMVAFDQVPFLFTTTDGGNTFVQHDVYQGGLFLASKSVTFTNSNIGYLAGSGVLKTYDGGQNWAFSLDFNMANGKLTDIHFASPDSGYTVGEGWYGPNAIFFKTTNAGATWIEHDPPAGYSTQLTCLARPSRRALYAGAASSGLRTLYKSTDDGNSWTTLNFTTSVHSLCFSSTVTGCAGAAGGIYRTTDGGLSWSHVLTTTGDVNCVRIQSGSGFAMTSTGSIYRTTDGGATWSGMSSPVEGRASLYSLCLLTPQLAYAVGSGGTLLRFGNTSDVESESPGGGVAALLLRNAPNPFRTETTITYRLPADGPVSLGLYDASGRIVRRILEGERPAGMHRIELPAGQLQSGVYYCRLAAAGTSQTRKVLIER